MDKTMAREALKLRRDTVRLERQKVDLVREKRRLGIASDDDVKRQIIASSVTVRRIINN